MELPNSIQDSQKYVPIQTCIWKGLSLSVELEHKAMWVMKKLKLDWTKAAEQILNGLNELNEFLLNEIAC